MKKCKCSEELLQDSEVKCPKCGNEELEIDLDLTGTPIANREKEIERRLKEAKAIQERAIQENERSRIEREKLEALKKNPDSVKDHYKNEEERTGIDARVLEETDRRINDQANRIVEQKEREKTEANLAINTTLDDLQNGDYPTIAKYRDEIVLEMRLYSSVQQKNPELIKKIAFGILGKNEAGKKEPKKEPKVVSTPHAQGGGSSGTPKAVTLTDEEIAFVEEHGLEGYNEKEVRDLYNQYLKTHPKK